jgi:tetratricopeptide (TPR) repeat protein
MLVESFNEAKAVIDAQQKNARAYALIGATLLGAGNFKQAKDALNSALYLDPEEPFALANQAMLDYHENRASWGLEKLRIAVFLEPTEPDFVFYLAQVSAKTENYKEAAAAYEKFLQIAPITDTDRRERIKGLIDFLRYLGSQRKLNRVDGKPQTTVKINIVNNRPVIPVYINGHKEPLNFVLDTGSSISVISDSTAKRLGLKSVARGGNAKGIGGDGKFEIVYGFLETMHIGEVQIKKVPVYIRKFYQSSEKFDGYIGISSISKFLTTVDYGNKYFSLVRQQKPEKDDETVLPVPESALNLAVPLHLTSSGFLSGEVKIDGIPEILNFIMDTGASVSVINSEVFDFYQLRKFIEPTVIRVFGAAGVTENVISLNLPRVDLGLHTQEKIQAAVLDLKPINESAGFGQAGILGGNFFKNYRLTFDFMNARILLEPSQQQKTKNMSDVIVSESFRKNE